MRRLGLGAPLRFLPGVRRLPAGRGVLIVDTGVARWYPLEIFPLLGYRKQRQEGDELVVSRRRYDTTRPRRISLGCGIA